MKNYFSIKELTYSETAVKNKIDNSPNSLQASNLRYLIETLDIIRDAFGKPINVNSGFRCDKLNKLVKGSKTSQHLKGQAADITVGPLNSKLFSLIKDLQKEGQIAFTQLINEYNYSWIHIGVDKNNLKNQIIAIK